MAANDRPCCPWCDDKPATTTIDTECGKRKVCYTCAKDYREWEAEQDRAERAQADAYLYDGPYFADTMSGGCIQL